MKFPPADKGVKIMSIKGEDIRNIAVIGHSGEGKTSVCEAILFNGKATDRLGKVSDGTTVTDCDDQEIARKMSHFPLHRLRDVGRREA